jgi:hypothetical protein
MADVETLRIRYSVDDSALDRSERKSTQLAGRVGKSFGRLAVGLGAGLVTGVGAAGFAVKKFADAAIESNKVAAQTAAVLKSTGGAAHVSATQVSDLATAISNKTGVDDEAIQSGENLLLTFTKVRNEAGRGNDVFNQATQTITDMSAALGQDTKASAIQLGKALQDPVRGVTALQRVGVSFTASQRDQIKALVESGHTLEAQKLILGELKTEFGGSAAAIATPFDRLKVTFGNIQEQLGNALLPVLNRVATFLAGHLPGVIDTVVRGFRALGAAFSGDGITTEAGNFVGIMERIGVAARAVAGFVKAQVVPALGRLGSFIRGQVIPAVAQLVGFFRSQVIPQFQKAAAFVRGQVAPALAQLGKSFRDNRSQIAAVVGAFGALVGIIVSRVVPILVRVFGVQLRQIISIVSAVVKAVGLLVRAVQAVASFFGTASVAIENFLAKIRSIPSSIHLPKLPHIPGFARGGLLPEGPIVAFSRSGPFTLNERGRERVVPAGGGGGFGGGASIHIHQQPGQDARAVIAELRFRALAG